MQITSPEIDLIYADREDRSERPSWTRPSLYLNDLHERIIEETGEIEGWQAPGDSYKLFELGYYSGDVILEIGIWAGRSATVELLGALSNPERQHTPQYFGVDIDQHSIARTILTLEGRKLSTNASVFYGNLAQFAAEVDIMPSMVFVDGDHSYRGVKADLNVLSSFLCAGTPVFCHDYWHGKHETGEYGVQQACNEWEDEGYAQFAGYFGVSALYVTTKKCNRTPGGLTAERFVNRQMADFQKCADFLSNALK